MSSSCKNAKAHNVYHHCLYYLFGLPADFQVTLLGKEVTFASSAIDLGLQVDSTLSSLLNISQTLFHHVYIIHAR